MKEFKEHTAVWNAVMMIAPPVVLIGAIIAFWQYECIHLNLAEWQCPSPARIFVAFYTQFGETLPYLLSTYFNILFGFALSVIVGIGMALIISNSKILAAALTPIIIVFCCMPMVTLVPLLLISIGTGPIPKIITIVIQCFPIINMNACVGFSNVDPARLELMESMKATRVQKYRYCIFRDAMPSIFTGVRLASVLAMISGVSAEICGGTGGLGNRISNLLGLSKTSEAFSCLVYVIILGILLYGLISMLEQRLTRGMQRNQ